MKPKFSIRVIGSIFCFLVIPFFAARGEDASFPDNLSGAELTQRSLNRYAGHDESTELWMVLTNSRGETRTRRFVRFQKNFPEGKRLIMKFLSPEDIRDTGFFNIEQPKEKYDTQFLFLPAVKKLRRVSAANKEQSWVGSDVFYEDLQETKFNDWTYNRLPDEMFDNFPCYVVEWIPKPGTETAYGKQIRWYRKDGYLPSRIDSYDKKGNFWKSIKLGDTHLNQGVWTGWIITAEDVQAKHKTEMYRRWMLYDTNLPDEYFTTRNLEKDISGYSSPAGLWETINSPSEYDKKIK